MSEQIVHIVPILLLAGLGAGWVAEVVGRAGGYGFLPDLVLGLVGSVVVGGIGWVVIAGETGMVPMFLIGCGGAVLAIVAQRRFWRSARLGT